MRKTYKNFTIPYFLFLLKNVEACYQDISALKQYNKAYITVIAYFYLKNVSMKRNEKMKKML